uniref:Uncharacterized protein n=1 Tax=Meloidogyne incognita TaxID=6306 RepID=A0A914M966_MELIC
MRKTKFLIKAQRNWPYHLFLLHTLFEFFESIFAEARKQISNKNNSVINQICDEKLSEKESEKCVDWLNNQSKILEKCNVKIETVFSARYKNLMDKWEDYSKNIKGIFEVEIVAGDAPAPAPTPEAPKVRKVIKVRGSGHVKDYYPESYEYTSDEYIYDNPRRYGRPPLHRGYRFMPYDDSFEVKGKYHVKSRPNHTEYRHQATYKYKGK